MSNSRNTVARPIQPILSLNIGIRGPPGRSLEPRRVLVGHCPNQQQHPRRTTRLCPSPSGSSIVESARNMRLQLRRQLLEELHHRRCGALQLSIIQQIIQQKASCRALYSSLTSNHAPPELYSLYSTIQRCILYSYTAYTVYSAIQSPSDTQTHRGVAVSQSHRPDTYVL